MITICIISAMTGTKLEKIKMVITAMILDSVYIIPVIF